MIWWLWLILLISGSVSLTIWTVIQNDDHKFRLGWLCLLTFIAGWAYFGYEAVKFP